MSCLKIITLACVFLELFPFDYFYIISCSLYFLKRVRGISMKLGTLIIKHNETMCHA